MPRLLELFSGLLELLIIVLQKLFKVLNKRKNGWSKGEFKNKLWLSKLTLELSALLDSKKFGFKNIT